MANRGMNISAPELNCAHDLQDSELSCSASSEQGPSRSGRPPDRQFTQEPR
ncbi:Hypothetical predicted protein [Marmota monax]|uniref:Uncharacterized protein n=1 Tax=Marmota monax TaxID=9995 RepID=A0A5E4B193_MARMO|nr:hypothetical protein GHT09_016089 [Marmota monax]VTJ63503.1 Hypothetical predicted protein [Marmota monax]